MTRNETILFGLWIITILVFGGLYVSMLSTISGLSGISSRVDALSGRISGISDSVGNLTSKVNSLAFNITHPQNFVAFLSGGEQVPSVVTRATGLAIFQLSNDGTILYYKLIIFNTDNITMAHIHLAPAGVNGPPVVWLYPSTPHPVLIPGRFDGVLAEGNITAANLSGVLAGKQLSDFMAEILTGNTYVNVHTDKYPGGEIRGQIIPLKG